MTDLPALSTGELLRTHGAILSELRHRDVVRSTNGPAGDYAELLFARAFDWRLQKTSASGHDAVDAAGNRFQIKCRRLTLKSGSRQLGFIRNLPSRPFDTLAAVLFEDSFRVYRAALIPVERVQERAPYNAHVNAWQLILRDNVWTWSGVRDVTADLKRIEATI